eukprot:s7921_g2.t1
MRSVLERWGFRIHDVSDAAPVVEGLGLLIDGDAGRVSLTARRIWKLRLASIALCRRRGAPLPKIAEKIIGHFTFAMLMKRETLSVFSHVYRCCRCGRPNPAIWALAKKEIMQASSLLPLMSSSMLGPWDTTVSATDSSDTGYGVCERHLPAPAVARTARTCEAWRYKVAGAIKARESALGLVDSGERLPHYLQEECARLCSSQFEEVQPFMLDPSAWHTVFSGRWHYEENILRTEGRDCISGVRHKLRSLRSCGKRHLLLVDNFSLALALTKGWGSSYIANRSCQQLCALSLASDCKFFVRWIPSERNCADKPLRAPVSGRLDGSRGSYASAPGGEWQSPGSAPTHEHRATLPAKNAEKGGRPSLDIGHTRRVSHLELFKVRRTATQDRYKCVLGAFLLWCEAHLPLCRNWDALLTAYLNPRGERQRRGVHVRRLQAQVPRVRQVRHGRVAQSNSSLGGIPKLGTAIDAPAYPKGCIHRHHWGHAVADRSLPAVGSVATARRTCKPDRRSIGSASWHGRHVQMGRDGDPSKTNLYDEGITLSPTVDFLTGAIAELRAARMSSPMLFPFTCAQLAEQFKKAAARVGVAHLGATLYGNRHGGASDMRLRGVGLPEIKKRGRWASDTSLRRYEKATVAQQQHLKVPVQTRVYADFVENQLKQLGPMLRRVIRVPSEDHLIAVQRMVEPLPELS